MNGSSAASGVIRADFLLGYSGDHMKCRGSELGTTQFGQDRRQGFGGKQMTSIFLVFEGKASLHAPRRLMDYSYSGMEFEFIQSDILGSQDIRRSTSR